MSLITSCLRLFKIVSNMMLHIYRLRKQGLYFVLVILCWTLWSLLSQMNMGSDLQYMSNYGNGIQHPNYTAQYAQSEPKLDKLEKWNQSVSLKVNLTGSFHSRTQERAVIINSTHIEMNKLDTHTEKWNGTYSQQSLNSKQGSDASQYFFNCSNIHEITLLKELGKGVSKQAYLGDYHNHKVVVKMVTTTVMDVTECVRKKLNLNARDMKRLKVGRGEHDDCFFFPRMKLMKEILMVQQLKHNGILPLLGYCLKSEEIQAKSVDRNGIVAVYPVAEQIIMTSLRSWDLKKRLTFVWEMADLFDFLEHSPMGSLCMTDLKDTNFMLLDGHLKISDYDDISSEEPSCDGSKMSCHHGVECIQNSCVGGNAKRNMFNGHRTFFQGVLFCEGCKWSSELTDIKKNLKALKMSAAELKSEIGSIIKRL